MIVKIDCETDGALHSTIKDVNICPTKTLGSLRGCVQYWSVSAAAPGKRSAFRTVLGPGGGTRREQPHTTAEIWGKQTDYIYRYLCIFYTHKADKEKYFHVKLLKIESRSDTKM